MFGYIETNATDSATNLLMRNQRRKNRLIESGDANMGADSGSEKGKTGERRPKAEGGKPMKCLLDGRRNCIVFFKKPDWVGANWLCICRNCPMKGYSLDAAKQLECHQQYEDHKNLYPFDYMRPDISVEDHIRGLGFEPDLVPDLVREEEAIATLVKNLHVIVRSKVGKIDSKLLFFIIELTDLMVRMQKNGCKLPENVINYLLKMPEFLSELEKCKK
jgi:hypothetical protein